jgi:tetratricopeptide (TPR) repeat protein
MVSNLFFNIGTFMNERFMFAPLLGFTVITAYFIHRFSLKKESIKLISGIFISISFIYLTISVIRNFTWKDDFTLFTHDVEISANSIKCNISAGGSYISKYEKTKNTKYLHTAEKHLLKAVQMDKSAANGHELLGKLYFLRQNYPLSLQFFKNLETLKPQDKQTKANIQAVLASMQTFGVDEASELLKQGNSQEAMRKVDDLIRANGASAQTYNLKGKIFGMGMNRIDSSLFYLNKAMVMDSTFYPAFENAGVAYAILKDFKKAEYYLLKAYTLSPNTPSIAHNLSNVYSEMGNREKSEKWKNMEN